MKKIKLEVKSDKARAMGVAFVKGKPKLNESKKKK